MANKNRMMPKATLKLRKIGGKYMIVETLRQLCEPDERI